MHTLPPSAAHWQTVSNLFDAAIEQPPEARASYVAAHAPSSAIADEVLTLLGEARAIEASDGEQIDTPGLNTGGAATATVFQPLSPGSRLGAWEVGAVIGRGGMGEVYAVSRIDGQYEQQAALKVVALDSAAASARFHAERRMLAQLDHPGIARILDGGTTNDGRPYMVMEYVDGQPITDHCEQKGLGFGERVDLFLDACQAVSHAHAQLIVHRDLKPGNLFVTRDGQVKLLDFGIAKVLSHAVDDLTRTQAVLTPVYASPEQLSNRPVSTAADVYSLGVLLFQLLTGRTPVDAVTASIPEVIDQVLDGNPPKASRVAAERAESPVPPARLSGDMDAILARCLRLEPDARYATVQRLADDLVASREHRPITARTGSRSYRLRRFFRRYAWQTAAVAALIATLSAGVIASATFAIREQAAAQTAERAAALAERRAQTEQNLRSSFARILGRAQLAEGGDAVLGFLDAHVADRLDAFAAGDPDAAYELAALGEVFTERGEPKRVADALTPVLNAGLDDPELRAQIQLQIGSAKAYAQDKETAIPLLESALTYFDALPGREYTALQAATTLASAQDSVESNAALVERTEAFLNSQAGRAMNAQSRGFLMNDYGMLLYRLERYAESEAALKASIAAYESRRGPLMNDVLYVWGNLAAAQAKMGPAKAQEALRTRRKVVALTETLQGPSLHLASMKRSLALALIKSGEPAAGLRMLDEVDRLLEQFAAPDATLTSMARGARIRGLAASQRHAEALALAQEHLALAQRDSSDKPATLGSAWYELANAQYAQGAMQEALAALDTADAIFDGLGSMRGAAMRRNNALRAKIAAAQSAESAD